MPYRPAVLFALSIVLVISTACDPVVGGAVTESEESGGVQNRGSNSDNWWDELPRPEWAAYERVPTHQNWFEVYKITSDIFAIYEPGQYEEVISFLLLGKERSLLFDTGLGIGNIRAVIEELTDGDVIVVNSHSHYDHIGGDYQFEQIYGRDLEYTRHNAAGIGHDDMAEWVSDSWIWKPLPEGFDRETYVSHPFQVNNFIHDGDRIDIGGRVLEVFFTPGHAPDAICLVDRENRLLFTGDTFYLAALYTHIEGSDFKDYSESAARLATLADQVDEVFTSHNVPVVSSAYLSRLNDAFQTIEEGSDDFETTDGNREYFFDGFSIIVKGL